MSKLITPFIIGIVASLAIGGNYFAYKNRQIEEPQLAVGGFSDPFISLQVGTNPTNGYVLQTDGTDSTWVATSSLGISGGSGTVTDELNDLLDVNVTSTSTGDVLYLNGSNWVNLAVGSDGQVLKLASGVPSWGTDNTSAGGGLATTTPWVVGEFVKVNSQQLVDSTSTVALDADVSEILPIANGGTGATSLNDLITLATHTTGNYVATIADAGNSTITVANSGTENAGVTLDVVDVNCTGCLGTTEIADSYILNTGDTIAGDLIVTGTTTLATTTATSLSVTGVFNFLGTAITNVSTWFNGLFDTQFATKDTDDLTEGATNLYNQTHTGDVTGATALTIASGAVDPAMLANADFGDFTVSSGVASVDSTLLAKDLAWTGTGTTTFAGNVDVAGTIQANQFDAVVSIVSSGDLNMGGNDILNVSDITGLSTINTLTVPSSNFVGISDSQTLTNKTIDGTNSITWSALTSYPTGCTNQFVTTIADTLTCASVTSASITDGAITNDDINASAAIAYSKLNLAGSIAETDLNANAPTDNYVLTASSTAAGGFAWEVAASGSSEWTDAGTVLYPTETTDQVAIGTSTPTDVAQLTVQASSTQTTSILSLINNSGNEIGNFASDGDGTIISYNAGATGPFLDIYHNSASPAQNDFGGITFSFEDSVGAKETYSTFTASIFDTTNDSEDGYGYFNVKQNGSDVTALRIGFDNTAIINGISVGESTAAGIVTSGGNQDLVLQTANSTTGTITITDGADGDITLAPNGVGNVVLPATTVQVGSSLPFSDSSGTLTLQNVDAIDATTETTFESAIDALSNLTTVGTITSGTWNATDIAVTAGGTGASDAATARTNLGLAIGTNVQAYDADLTTYAGITPSANVQSILGAANYAAIVALLESAIESALDTLSNLVTVAISTTLQIPFGTACDSATDGELCHDTTDDQLVLAGAVVGKTTDKIWSITVASTSEAFVAGTLLPIPTELDGYTMTAIRCKVDSGTSKVIAVEDASANSTEDITCLGTVTSDDGSITNAGVTAAEEMYIDFGATTGAVDYVTISAFGTWTRE